MGLCTPAVRTVLRARTFVSYVLLALLFLGPFVKLTASRSCCSTSSSGGSSSSASSSGRRTSTCSSFRADRCRHRRVLTSAVGRIWCGWMCPQTIFPRDALQEDRMADRGLGAAAGPARQGSAHVDTVVAQGAQARHLLRAVVPDRQRLPRLHRQCRYAVGHRHGAASRTRRRVVRDLGLQPGVLCGLRALPRAGVHVACPYGRVMGALVDEHTITITYDRSAANLAARWVAAQRRKRRAATASTVGSASPYVRPASTSVTASSSNASHVRPVPTRATT